MAAVSLFWNTNLTAVTSCENAIYPLIFGYFLLYKLFIYFALKIKYNWCWIRALITSNAKSRPLIHLNIYLY